MGQWVKNLPASKSRRRCRFNPWVRKISWRRKWQPTPAILLEKFRGQRSLSATDQRVAKSPTQLSTAQLIYIKLQNKYLSKYFGTQML